MESCLRGRLCENLNAEICAGTVHSIGDAVGYLSWTFFARRLKANPSYYGAKISEEGDSTESFLLSVVQETLDMLKNEKCVTILGDMKDIACEIQPSSLGAASSEFYLQYRTPKQMQFGLNECSRMLLRDRVDRMDMEMKSGKARPLSIGKDEDERSIAWILYTMACTHEFDELPVRHNEEILNEELSRSLMWGPDTTKLESSNGSSSYVDPDIYAQSHTK